MSAVRARLPGFRFETQAPPLDEILPRMDIAAFVGFAASGPLQTPVVLESEAQFDAIFGQDAPLAWDVERGEQVFAYLAPAVRSFFRNHGRRCWVIRVARQEPIAAEDLNYARSNYFPIPGLARAVFDGGQLKQITPAFARARSEGSWSDSLQVSAALLVLPVTVNSLAIPSSELDSYEVNLNRVKPEETEVGDLLRFTFQDAGRKDRYVLFLGVQPKELQADEPPPPLGTLAFVGNKPVWFEITDSLPAPGSIVNVAIFTREFQADSTKEDVTAGFEHLYQAVINPQFASPPNEDVPAIQQTGNVVLKLLNCEAAD